MRYCWITLERLKTNAFFKWSNKSTKIHIKAEYLKNGSCWPSFQVLSLPQKVFSTTSSIEWNSTLMRQSMTMSSNGLGILSSGFSKPTVKVKDRSSPVKRNWSQFSREDKFQWKYTSPTGALKFFLLKATLLSRNWN